MAFEYMIWLSPEGYEKLYLLMRENGESSLKAMIKRVLVQATESDREQAIMLARVREAHRGKP